MRKHTKRKVRPLVNPLHFVLAGMVRLTDLPMANVDLRLKNHIALESLAKGEANGADLDRLIASMNIANALRILGIGDDPEYNQLQDDAIASISSVRDRFDNTGRMLCTGPELTAIKRMYEFHDAQLDKATVYELDSAIKLVSKEERRLRSQHGNTKKERAKQHEVQQPSGKGKDRTDQADPVGLPHAQT